MKKPAKKTAKKKAKSQEIEIDLAVWPKRRPKGVPSILVREVTPRIYDWALAIERNGVHRIVKRGWEHTPYRAYQVAAGAMSDWRKKHRFTYEQEMNPMDRSLFDTGEAPERPEAKPTAAEVNKRRFALN